MLRATSLRPAAASARQVARSPVVSVRAPVLRSAVLLHQLAEEVVAEAAKLAPGSVDAPIGVVIGAAVFIAVAATALVPLALKPGEEASSKIFTGQNLGKTTVKKPAAGSKASKR